MLQTCPACHAENSDTAKFCDQCGAPLSPELEAALAARPVPAAPVAVPEPVASAPIAPAAVARPQSAINWNALLVVAAIVLGIFWVTRTPQQPAAPMAGGASAGGAGGPAAGGNPIGMMEDVQKQLNDLKAKLKKDPLDVAALSDMYMMYSQIGQTEKVKPSMEAALKAWQKKHPNPNSEDLKTLAGLALVALQASDDEMAVQILKAYHKADPDNLGVIGTIGNLYYEMDQPTDAIEHYDLYLAKATPKEQGKDYWNILVDKATMHLHRAGEDTNSADYQETLQLLARATKESPDHWAAWFNLGQAHKIADEKEQALAAFKKSLEKAADEMAKYDSQREINLLEGKPAPTPPANPHGEMGMGSTGGVSLPKPPPGTPNPHTEGGEGGLPMPPPGTPNPHTEGSGK